MRPRVGRSLHVFHFAPNPSRAPSGITLICPWFPPGGPLSFWVLFKVSASIESVQQLKRPTLSRVSDTAAGAPAPWLGGVCAGISVQTGISVVAVRALAVAAALLGGVGVLAYVWLWITLPEKPGTRPPAEPVGASGGGNPELASPDPFSRRRQSRQLFFVGMSLLALTVILAASPSLLGIPWTTVAWGVAILAGLSLVWVQAPRLTGPDRAGGLVLVLSGVGLVTLGIIMIVFEHELVPEVILGVLIAALVASGVLAAVIPLGIRVVRDLTASKEREAREAERADIAAHLHDSVLQTLTLIRAGAEDPARVRALALSQERELRSWLYTGRQEAQNSLVRALQVAAEEVEATYGIPVEVVTVGDSVTSPSALAAVAAAAEAITNAARHGAPPISVYQECGPTTLEIFIKDSGPGFDPGRIPAGRLGFRQSVLGRVSRAGGQVTVRSAALQGAGTLARGTEVKITVPLEPAPTPPQRSET